MSLLTPYYHSETAITWQFARPTEYAIKKTVCLLVPTVANKVFTEYGVDRGDFLCIYNSPFMYEFNKNWQVIVMQARNSRRNAVYSRVRSTVLSCRGFKVVGFAVQS
jgi:hypothetical protein